MRRYERGRFDPNLLDEVTFIDVEASALENGYPIEIGWATVDVPGRALKRVESFLIRPPAIWLEREDGWSEASFRIHGITVEKLLADGVSPEEAIDRLDAALAGWTVFSDSPKDQEWLDRLYRDGTTWIRPRPFFRKDVAVVLERRDTDEMRVHAALKERGRATRKHRAADDAREWAQLFLNSRLSLL